MAGQNHGLYLNISQSILFFLYIRSWFEPRLELLKYKLERFLNLHLRSWENTHLWFFFRIEFLKVCHSSAFQTISVRSVYIKIINYSGNILAITDLNNTMQTKQDTMKKPHSYSYRKTIYKGFYLVEGFWAENVQNLPFLLIQ